MGDTRTLAYKGLELMPTWFQVMAVVLVVIGIALAAIRGNRR
jgi:hypothetical protein